MPDKSPPSGGEWVFATESDYTRRELIAEWVRSRSITISTLGIRISVDDLPVIGSVGLIVVLIWLYLSSRRENYTIGFLLRDYFAASHEQRRVVFYSINLNTVFTTLVHADNPVRSVTGPIPADRKSLLLGWSIWFLFALPVIAVVATVALDFVSLL